MSCCFPSFDDRKLQLQIESLEDDKETLKKAVNHHLVRHHAWVFALSLIWSYHLRFNFRWVKLSRFFADQQLSVKVSPSKNLQKALSSLAC